MLMCFVYTNMCVYKEIYTYQIIYINYIMHDKLLYYYVYGLCDIYNGFFFASFVLMFVISIIIVAHGSRVSARRMH